MRLLLVIPAVSCVVAGCAALSYTEPNSGDRARIRFVTDTKHVSVLRTYEGPDCAGKEQEWMRLRVGPLLTGSAKRLGMPLWDYHENAAKEVYVAAGRPFSAIFWGTGFETTILKQTYFQCGVPIATTFEAGKDYEVKYSWHPSACTVSIAEIVSNHQVHQTRVIGQLSNRAPRPDSACLAHFKRFRLD